MDKEKIIEILEDYEFFVDDDFGGHYEHINCSQKALTPLGIIEILDYISELEQQVKKQKEVINDVIEYVENRIVEDDYMLKVDTDMVQKELLDKLKDKEV